MTMWLCAWQYGRLSPSTWGIPTAYSGDAMEIMARIKAVSEGELKSFTRQTISRLGAPLGADWSEYPASDALLFQLLGTLARVVGVGAACNLALLFAHVSSSLAFYFCSRWLRHRWEWAFAGALLFSFTFHSVSRGLAHLSLVFTWTVPLALLCCALIARSHRLVWRSRGWWLCVGTAAALAVSNPYNLFLFMQLLGWAWVAQWVGDRRPANLRTGLLCGGLAVGLLALLVLPVWLHAAAEGGDPLLARNYGGTEMYALKPIELLLPPDVHRSGWLASLGSRYLRWSDWRGEVFSPYLGVIAGGALVWMLGLAAVRLLARKPPPGQALPALWVLAFSAVGGGNALLAFYLGIQVFRATNRYSIFLSALALLFLAAGLSRWFRRWPRGVSIGAAGLVAGFGLWDQLPRSDPEAVKVAAVVRTDRAFGAELERVLPREAMIYQLPYVEFPEGRAVRELQAYEHFRPYLATDHLRFTFGAVKNRARSSWQLEYQLLPPEELVAALERAGFSGIYLNRRAHDEEGWDGLIQALRSAGTGEVLASPDGDRLVIRLEPSPEPVPPLGHAPTFGRGWNDPEPSEGDVRWSHGPASMAWFNPHDYPISAQLIMQISAVGPRGFTLVHNGRPILERTLDEEPVEIDPISLELNPGLNRFDFRTDGAAVRVSEERGRLRSLGVHAVSLKILTAEDEPFAGP